MQLDEIAFPILLAWQLWRAGALEHNPCPGLVRDAAYAVARLGRVDILGANAGIWNAKDEPIETLGERAWDQMIRESLKSVYTVTHFAVPGMIAQRSGSVINMSSIVGLRAGIGDITYSTVKAAVIHATRCAAVELGEHGVRVSLATLSYWQSGRSRPERRESLIALQHLEDVLRVPRGSLADTCIHPHGFCRNVLVAGPRAGPHVLRVSGVMPDSSGPALDGPSGVDPGDTIR